jgi:hypothetical protein
MISKSSTSADSIRVERAETRLSRLRNAVSVDSDETAVAPETTAVKRLTKDAGELLNVEPDGSVPREQVKLQAEANGYDDPEQLLIDDVGPGSDPIAVPSEKDLFGPLWAPEPASESESRVPSHQPQVESRSEGEDTTGYLQQFRDWCQQKVESDSTRHAYSRRLANKWYSRAKDVDRYFSREYEQFSTVLITHTLPRNDDESVTDHCDRFYPRSVKGKVGRIRRGLDVPEYAGLRLLAPKPPTEYQPPAHKCTTHAHSFYWFPPELDESAFSGLDSLFAGTVQASVRTHTASEVETPSSVLQRGTVLDARRGATTTLPQEVGANLPCLKTTLDARGLPEYGEVWCANLSCAADGDPSNQGVSRRRSLGRFSEVADAQQFRRQFGIGAVRARRLVSSLVGP